MRKADQCQYLFLLKKIITIWYKTGKFREGLGALRFATGRPLASKNMTYVMFLSRCSLQVPLVGC